MKTIISSVNNEKIKFLKKVKSGKEKEYFLIEGYHLVEEAIKANLVKEIYEINYKKVIYEKSIIITENVLNSITSTKTPEGIVALCIKKDSLIRPINKVVFLDDVQDPGNVGTIIRSSLAFGFDTIISNVNFYNEKIVRSSQGAIFKVNLINYKNPVEIINEYKKKGYKTYATVLDQEAVEFKKVIFENNNIIVILGNEGKGIRQEILNISDKKIYIPIDFESLNVAVAAGIILCKIYNK
ncbi:TrmH family RNA methyltransferase [Mycoplasma tauri]|uniref:RNA methyltransferase n=1 Tax=Mycoplasma tauri TaxID=547987 RepID=A0A953NDC7_9MOLU|nr:RNA methyltransferase [Mycoplasma tauri]MBZ4195515.1 RNA methyltransferase [Mycoplasma tauri]MBZ4204318.1 RNA methyltransferase [Mycoplasma tauri]MBZ4212845.1 RNA methyltransferase [Mycoplasma tauri]MBZ4218370.1 RNA methyltransferase [Mycoplasma tauri]MBZ4226584.1 RNA methyltransferase [Mycoplasma tauri]